MLPKNLNSDEKIWDRANSAFSLMKSQNIPATPRNFTVWYDHFSGTNLDLSQYLEGLLKNNVEFTDARNQEIYADYYGQDREIEAVRETGGRIEAAIAQVLGHLDQAGKSTSGYSEKLTDATEKLADREDAQDVSKLVQELLEETHEIIAKNRSLEQDLNRSAQEIDELRRNLEQVRQESVTDCLTGLANRKYFDAKLHDEIAIHSDSGGALSLMMLDIDHFKKFNDDYGHSVGDQVLKVVAGILKDGVKGRDTAARYGGEEFAVILPETRLENAAAVAENLRNMLATRALKNKKTGENYGTITISVGIAQYRPEEPSDDFLQRADEHLYKAKQDGRNRVVIERAAVPPLGLVS